MSSEVISLSGMVVWGGFSLAVLFGYVAHKTSFCTMGAVSDVVNMSDWGRMRAWMLAMAIAILGANTLSYLGLLNLADTLYTAGRVYWGAALVGGLCFGVGMTLAGGCAQRTLVRVGGGNLKSIVVFLFLGYSALVTIRGIFGAFRVGVLQSEPLTLSLGSSSTIPSLLGLDAQGQLGLAAAIFLLMAIFVFKDREFRHSRDNLLAGVVAGLTVVAGWYLAGHLGYSENPDTMEMTYLATNSRRAESLSFVAPIGYTMDLWAYWTDTQTKVTFGIATVFGIGIGSFLYAMLHKTFRWEYFTSPQDLFAHIIGAALMGFGGVTAMGCTIGQGVTGLSTLALSSVIALTGILAGAAMTMKLQYRWMMREN
ncbi:MAG: YeeE/YedE family protein [Betaproteobacteria bacterium]|nr:YeeE/YedE family protein [Betaproteobacteria bacterium]